MISLIINQSEESHSFIVHTAHLLHDGGLFFMLPILATLFLVFFLIIRNALILKKTKHLPVKYIKIINSIGLMILVWGVLGQLLGLVQALDTIEFLGEISTARLAGGLKVSALPTMFGCLVFVISRIATVIFTWISKDSE
ncbi:hypothetical protein D1818_04185 [Aquimarina sp. BL5]|uniref:MotA/TolQ/ExbB proton channel family protein n=1 Tax=Aquimarina sp. BL5 TaxID=1714860 RepID=UPI000E5327A9|nr:MotA/TolQ/ExbB proton channel family protein [Aquimarina sp. BL5]AXT50067.1 hypothetical protein D1818_04185 [Aquimarina sp. BL5]RKM94657.1 hypothetical protein D7036_21745 [Aquimarina sp. BL5]